ncbi:MAG TPA: helix-turn-helix domain-containing protein [Candidatus Paenibacillus intestinavium]|nr:helix-turn-helix domain-containing protein [Candidatus Paenibacillus intestinavium]
MLKLRAKIIEAGTTQEAVADQVGMNRTTFYRKVKSEGLSFTIGEIHKIANAINLTQDDAIEIFLDTKSHLCDSTNQCIGI